MAQKLPDTVMRKRERDREGGRKEEKERENTSEERVFGLV